jgi:hypothetical protein
MNAWISGIRLEGVVFLIKTTSKKVLRLEVVLQGLFQAPQTIFLTRQNA